VFPLSFNQCRLTLHKGFYMKDPNEKHTRQYSPVYEKSVPVIIGIIAFLVIGVLIFAGAVALDLIPMI